MNSRGIDPDKESVIDIPLEEISDFPDHPFKVKLDESMSCALIKSGSCFVSLLYTPEIVRITAL